MHYVKNKREKNSICNLCKKEKPLSWDHVPPKGGIELTKVEMETVFSLLAGGQENPNLKESQNGVKYRTLCKECNELLGLYYDPSLNDFARSVGRYLDSDIELPKTVTHEIKPQRLFKSLLGHLIAAKVDIENTSFDETASLYVLDKNAKLPTEINIFYWVYPYTCTIIMREFCMFVPRGTYDEPTVFQILKYFPIAYLFADKTEYANLNSLARFRGCGLDEIVEISIDLSRIEDSYWPEAPTSIDEGGNVIIGGQSFMNSIHAKIRQ